MSVPVYEFILPQKPEPDGAYPTDEVEVEYIPDFLKAMDDRGCVVLEAGASTTLDHRVDEVALNFEWTFKPEIEGVDVDSSVALFKGDLSLYDFVWWDNPETKCKTVRYLAAEGNQGMPGGTTEIIQMHLQKIPDPVQFVVLAVSVYSKDHTMDDLQEITISLDTPANERIAQYKMAVNSHGRSFLMGCFVRKKDSWELHALSEALLSRTISEIMHEPANLAYVSTIQPTPRIRRRVVIQPLEGKTLTPMDFTLFRKRSDPYLKIFVDDRMIKSEVKYGTLNPKFICEAVDLGEVSETSTKVVEVQCWDYDKLTQHDSMGAFKFCLGGLMSNVSAGVNKIWFKIHPTEEHIRTKKEITGHVLFSINVEEFA